MREVTNIAQGVEDTMHGAAKWSHKSKKSGDPHCLQLQLKSPQTPNVIIASNDKHWSNIRFSEKEFLSLLNNENFLPKMLYSIDNEETPLLSPKLSVIFKVFCLQVNSNYNFWFSNISFSF